MSLYIIESETRPPQHRRLIRPDVLYTTMILPFPKQKTSNPNYLVVYMCDGKKDNTMFFVYLEAQSLEEAERLIDADGDTTFATTYEMYVEGQLRWREGIKNE